MRKLLRLIVFSLCLIAVTITAVKAEAAQLSPALEVISNETRLIKCSVGGERVNFNCGEVMELVGTEFDYLTLKSLPPIGCGVLKVAGVDAIPDQTLSAAGVELLSFLPSQEFADNCSFSFTVTKNGKESRELACVIRYSATPRFAPIAVSATLKTYKNVSVTAALGAYDPDGDDLEYVIEQYPTGGRISLNDDTVTYTPKTGFCGEDSFTYYAVNDWGEKSELAKATVSVAENDGGIYFADMVGEQEHLAAIRMSEDQVMSYRLIGDSYYFSPAEEVSRIDFAVMLVSAAGIKVEDKLYPSNVFTDTASQSRGKRLYLEAAVTNGIVKAESDSFRPNESIKLEDALVMAERATGDEGSLAISSAWFENSSETLTKREAALILDAVKY